MCVYVYVCVMSECVYVRECECACPCVWGELFLIFTFCNKELAQEHIRILPVRTNLPDVDGSFDINKAHCFDANEEVQVARDPP